MSTLITLCALVGATAEPVAVVEMFTSQGCSSCPPADRVLSALERAGEVEDVEVIPLSFHVDYWNYIGWRDPFSSGKWTERQQHYSRVLPSGAYTPQAVVNGKAHEVGSRRQAVRRLVAKHAYRGERSLSVKAERDKKLIKIRLSGDSRKGQTLVVVLTESDLDTEVERGENRGRRLHHDAVVKKFRHLDGFDEGAFERELEFRGSWQSGAKLAVIAFWQDPVSRVIGDARRTRVP